MRSQIETKAEVEKLFAAASGGDRDAYNFLLAFDLYVEEIEALLQAPSNHTEFIRLLAKTSSIYTLPFYVRNAPMLQLTITEALQGMLESQTVKGGEPWLVQWAEYSGAAMARVVMAVAMVKIGFEKASELRQTVRELAWATRKQN